MTTNLYVCLDKQKLADKTDNTVSAFVGTFAAPSDGVAIRDNLIPLIKIIHVEKDVGIFHVGFIDLLSGVTTPCEPREVSHDSYQMPETPTKNESVSDALQQQMNKAFLR